MTAFISQGTNTVMAGMFSMLNSSRLKLDSCGNGNTTSFNREENGRITPNRSPLPVKKQRDSCNVAHPQPRYGFIKPACSLPLWLCSRPMGLQKI